MRSTHETTVLADARSSPQRSGLATAIVVGGFIVATGSLLVASVLWVKYGTAVFFGMIASGIAACF